MSTKHFTNFTISVINLLWLLAPPFINSKAEAAPLGGWCTDARYSDGWLVADCDLPGRKMHVKPHMNLVPLITREFPASCENFKVIFYEPYQHYLLRADCVKNQNVIPFAIDLDAKIFLDNEGNLQLR